MLVGGPAEPLLGELPRVSTSEALTADRKAARRADPAAQWAGVCRSSWTDFEIDGDRLLGRPRTAVGYVLVVDGPALASWAAAETEAWRREGMTADDWSRAAVMLRDWWAGREAERAAGRTAEQRRHDELTAQRRAEQRRAELVAQRAAADEELARLDGGELPAAPTPPRSGWLRRTTSP